MITNRKDLIVRHEGRVNKLYRDSYRSESIPDGYWTFGVGHMCDPRIGGTIPWPVVDLCFDIDLAEHEGELVTELPWVKDLDEVRYAVLVDMYFNLRRKLLGFHNTLQAVKEGRWESAARGMMSSLWAKQVGPRAARLAQMMRTGQWPTG